MKMGKKGGRKRDGKPVRNTSMQPRREITARYIGFEERERVYATETTVRIRMNGEGVG